MKKDCADCRVFFLWRKNEKLPAGILYFLFIAAFGLIVMDIEKTIAYSSPINELEKSDVTSIAFSSMEALYNTVFPSHENNYKQESPRWIS